jgi:AraC-like DNA-binding protein
MHQKGLSPDGWTTFGFPKKGTVDLWQGQSIGGDALLSFDDKEGFDGITAAGFAANVISFDTHMFWELAETCGFELSEPGSAVREITSKQGVACLNRMEKCVSHVLKEPHSQITRSLEEALMLDAMTFQTQSEALQDKSRGIVRGRALRNAIDLMLADLETPVSIADICRESGASWRTLDRAFKERFGYGPKTYYMRLRLNRVREDLFKATASDSITDVANRRGFWHMGQFARDYQLFFGELPSQTRSG